MYNYIIDLNYKYKCNRNLPHKKAALFHFVGLTKPWHTWSIFYEECSPFKVAKLSSPWRDEPLISPRTKNNYKYAAKHLRFNGLYLKSIINYLQYKVMS
ncbi:hypothetical protein HH682_12260 [Rosenbergiella sp. S61]|uniref:Glycosyl transferase family 8 C-terminal domain-containing protein n=1 Tax=Rosenbergiella gaditana TaxID=2726987 RepID=A0ABS5T113_9GAMM|nr:hypothetical protein [Rosenbergiella gaditana]